MALLHPPTLHPCWAAVNRQHSSTWFQPVVRRWLCADRHLARRYGLGWKNGFPPPPPPAQHKHTNDMTATTAGQRDPCENVHPEHVPALLLCAICNSPAQPATKIFSATYITTESGIKVFSLPPLRTLSFGGCPAVGIFPVEQSTNRSPELTLITKGQLSSSFYI